MVADQSIPQQSCDIRSIFQRCIFQRIGTVCSRLTPEQVPWLQIVPQNSKFLSMLICFVFSQSFTFCVVMVYKKICSFWFSFLGIDGFHFFLLTRKISLSHGENVILLHIFFLTTIFTKKNSIYIHLLLYYIFRDIWHIYVVQCSLLPSEHFSSQKFLQ